MSAAAQVVVTQDPEGILIKPQGGQAGNILIGNLPACNAIIHIIDRVLLPNLASLRGMSGLQTRLSRCCWHGTFTGLRTLIPRTTRTGRSKPRQYWQRLPGCLPAAAHFCFVGRYVC